MCLLSSSWLDSNSFVVVVVVVSGNLWEIIMPPACFGLQASCKERLQLRLSLFRSLARCCRFSPGRNSWRKFIFALWLPFSRLSQNGKPECEGRPSESASACASASASELADPFERALPISGRVFLASSFLLDARKPLARSLARQQWDRLCLSCRVACGWRAQVSEPQSQRRSHWPS